MSRSTLSTRRLLTACLTAHVSLLMGCGADLPLTSQHLRLTAVEAPAMPESRVVQAFSPAVDRDAWTITADEISLIPRDDGSPGSLLRLTRESIGTPIRLVRSGEFDLATFDTVRLRLACSGGTLASAAFLRNGNIVAATEPVPVTHLASVGTVELVLPPVAAERETATSILLFFGDTPRAVRLESVELLATPAARLVPPAEGSTTLARLGGEARRGVGVSCRRPVEAEFIAPPAGVLGFGLGVPPNGRWQGNDPLLVVTLTAAGEAPRVTEYSLQRGDRLPVWRDLRLPLDGLGGQRVTAHFELHGPAGQDAACVVSEAAVWSRRMPPRPPLLLITTDTHRGDHLGGARRSAGVDTPVLDALAARGVLFEDCFTTANYTNPSHMALMTGRHPRDVGILTNKQALADTAETLAERLRDAGYRTYAALSAHHLGDAVSGLGQGFDRMTWPELPQRPSEDTLDVVEQWLAAQDGIDDERPLFLWLHVFDAHRPYDPPAELVARYYDGPPDPYDSSLPALPEATVLPREMEGLRVLEYPRAQYKALVSYLDGQLARVVDHPALAGAVVAVVGDHGEELGDHGVWFDHAELYTDTLHVPLILAWPGAPAGQRESRAVSHLDLGRTLLDLVGLVDAEFPGVSLVQTGVESGAGTAPTGGPRYALSSHGSSASLTVDGLHLILHLRSGHRRYEHHQVELYDLLADPTCVVNLMDENERLAEARALRAQLVRWLSEAPSDSLRGATVTDPGVLADLAQLGYVGETGGGAATDGEALWVADGCAWCLRME